MAAACWRCGEDAAVSDPDSGALVCSSCGVVLSGEVFHHQAFDSTGAALGSLVLSVASSSSARRDRTIYHSKNLLSDLSSRLSLGHSLAAEATQLAHEVTGGDFGSGEWFRTLASACVHIAARRRLLPLPLSEIASAAACDDAREVARMADRVIRHLDLSPPPQFNAAESLERTLRSRLFIDLNLDESKTCDLISQGKFLVHCTVKWSLSTGRQPLPLVAAVVALIAESNSINVKIVEIAEELYANISTSKVRFKELKETLVKVAKKLLPWGADVNPKNVAQHAVLLIKLMESKANKMSNSIMSGEFGEVFGVYDSGVEEDDSKYFSQLDSRSELLGFDFDENELDRVLISSEQLERGYKRVLERLKMVKENGGLGKDEQKKKRKSGLDFDLLKDSLQAENGLNFEQVMSRDLGFDCMPPSYLGGLESRRHRREKIEAAKCRIKEIMKPTNSLESQGMELALVSEGSELPLVSEGNELACVSSESIRHNKRRRKPSKNKGLDWEDCIIELLLLHHVNEDEIEEGQYARLVDLYVFNYLGTKNNRLDFWCCSE